MMVACILLGIDTGTPEITMNEVDNATVMEKIIDQRYANICTVSTYVYAANGGRDHRC